MRRRDFLLLAGGTAAWPIAARAEPMRRVGVLVGLAAGPEVPGAQLFLGNFREAMHAAGWVEGENVRFDYRFGGALNDLGKTRTSAAELVALKPDVIYAQGLPACLALRAETTTIPIVFTQLIDPVGFGLAQSIGHPGQRHRLHRLGFRDRRQVDAAAARAGPWPQACRHPLQSRHRALCAGPARGGQGCRAGDRDRGAAHP
jgi:hypothetical protein